MTWKTGAGAAAATLALAGSALTGCGLISAMHRIAHDVRQNQATVSAFTSKLTSGPATFAATYTTTGLAPDKVIYAVGPRNELTIREQPTGGGRNRLDMIVNGSGAYSCSPAVPGRGWACQRLGKAAIGARQNLYDIYTPSHWAGFLHGVSVAAGFAGDKITTSSMTVRGFSLSCVDLRVTAVPGASRICVTSQGVLGYVAVAPDSTRFELTSYTAVPAASLFQLPPGAKIVKSQPGQPIPPG